MMGDNRDNSQDSRFWGALPENLVKGKAMVLYWSWDADRRLPRLNRIFRPIL
jgi:signal peptidase I